MIQRQNLIVKMKICLKCHCIFLKASWWDLPLLPQKWKENSHNFGSYFQWLPFRCLESLTSRKVISVCPRLLNVFKFKSLTLHIFAFKGILTKLYYEKLSGMMHPIKPYTCCNLRSQPLYIGFFGLLNSQKNVATHIWFILPRPVKLMLGQPENSVTSQKKM